VAKQDEVEPTGASDAAEPSDATDKVTVGQPGDDKPVDQPGEKGPGGDAQGPANNDAAKVLEPAGVAATTTGSRAGARDRAPARTPKTAPTAKRDQPVKPERTTPLKFVRQSVGELRKVVYPTGQQLINYFIVVLVFVLFVIAYVSLLDLGFGAAIFRIFS
jgi:preprotein translocase subunit SecE